MTWILSSYRSGLYICTGYNPELKHVGMRTINTATYAPQEFRPLSSISNIIYGTIKNIDEIKIHTKIRYKDIVVRFARWPSGSDGSDAVYSTSPAYSPPEEKAMQGFIQKYGNKSYKDLLRCDGWEQHSTIEYRKIISIRDLEFESVPATEYFAV